MYRGGEGRGEGTEPTGATWCTSDRYAPPSFRIYVEGEGRGIGPNRLVQPGVRVTTTHLLPLEYHICRGRAVGPHSFFADPAVFLNKDPAAFKMWIRIQLKNIWTKQPYEEFSFFVKKTHKRLLKSKKQRTFYKFTLRIWITVQFLPISLHFFCFDFLKIPPGSGSTRENKCESGSTALCRGGKGGGGFGQFDSP